MSDVSVAPEQDQIAESLMGEPEQQPVEGVEQQEVEQEPQQVEAESQEETAEDWLPNDQDKVFPDAVYAKYAERYGFDPEKAADPQLRQLLHDKINTDIFVRQQQQQQEEWERQQAQEPETQPEPTQQQLTREQYFANITRQVAERTDPQVAKEFHQEFLRAFNVPEEDIARATPQQAMQFTGVMSKYALNLFQTFFPDMLSQQLPQHISQAFPGFGDMYERSSYAMAWDQVRNSNPQYQALPAYGTKEFSKTLREAAAKIPGFDEMQFTDNHGKSLPPQANAARKYAMLAQMASGQNVDPALLQRAAAAGARNANRAAVRRSAGNLGSGQSKAGAGANSASQFQTNQDLFDSETMANYQNQHGRL